MVRKKMNLKKRKRKKLQIKLIIYLTFMYIGFAYTFYYSFKEKETISNEELTFFIYYLLSRKNYNTRFTFWQLTY